jgi:hypothetical protein
MNPGKFVIYFKFTRFVFSIVFIFFTMFLSEVGYRIDPTEKDLGGIVEMPLLPK